MGILDKLKNEVKKSGSNKGKILYFREGVKTRVRFLSDMDDALEVVFHDSYEKSINVPCQEFFGKSCPYCEDEDLRTRAMYAWSVWDYDSNEVKLILSRVNNCSPVPSLMAMYENYGTLTDRDYAISATGKQQNKTFQVVPLDKVKFRNAKAKAFSETAIKKMLDKAFPSEHEDYDEDEYEDKPVKKTKTKSKSKPKEEDYDDEDNWDEEENESYEDMSAIELFKLCKSRDIEAAPRKSERYYIKLLEEADEMEDEWGDEDDYEDD